MKNMVLKLQPKIKVFCIIYGYEKDRKVHCKICSFVKPLTNGTNEKKKMKTLLSLLYLNVLFLLDILFDFL